MIVEITYKCDVPGCKKTLTCGESCSRFSDSGWEYRMNDRRQVCPEHRFLSSDELAAMLGIVW